MTKEQMFFIRVLLDFMHEKETDAPDCIDWNVLFNYSKSHQVSGILYYQCKDFIPEENKQKLNTENALTLYNHVHYLAELTQLRTLFKSHNIEMFTIKGLDIAQFYPVPALRTMGDLDIIIHAYDREKVHDILVKQGFMNIKHQKNKEWTYIHNNMLFEIHDHLVYKETINRNELESFFNDYWSYAKDGKLDDSFHFLFLILHIRKHLMNVGVGFRQFMDIALMGKKDKSINWKWIKEKLEELGLLKFASMCSGFIYQWFGITIPIKPAELDNCFYEETTNIIFMNGIFGFDNENNKTNGAVNSARKTQHRKWGMLKGAWKYIFLSYQELRSRPQYSYLDKRPGLLPIVWCHRFTRGIKSIPEARKRMRMKVVSKETIDTRDAYLKNWGL